MINDIELLRPYDEFGGLIDQACLQPILLFQCGAMRDAFTNFDVTIIRKCHTTVSIPPIEYVVPSIADVG